MDYESSWQNLLELEASLALPPPEFEAYRGVETDQKARGSQQAFDYFSAARPGSSHQSSNITDTDKKGQDLETIKDQIAKKRKIDKAYRDRCKAGANDTDLQRENALLKSKIVMLLSQVNDQNNLDKLQLQEKNAQLEHDKSSLEVIVQALCEKINNEKGHEGDHASS